MRSAGCAKTCTELRGAERVEPDDRRRVAQQFSRRRRASGSRPQASVCEAARSSIGPKPPNATLKIERRLAVDVAEDRRRRADEGAAMIRRSFESMKPRRGRGPAGVAVDRETTTGMSAPPISHDRLQRWRNRWEGAANGTQTLGWHIPEPHHALVKFLDQLLPGDREPTQQVLFPLSGKRSILDFSPASATRRRRGGRTAREYRAARRLWRRGGRVVVSVLRGVHRRSRPSTTTSRWSRATRDDAAANAQAVGRAHDAAFDRGALVAVRPEDRDGETRARSRRCSRRARASCSWPSSTIPSAAARSARRLR